MNAKGTMAWMLGPATRLATSLARSKRIWAYARLASLIEGPLDPSVVVLGVPEVHGTGRIRLGKNLFLYRDLHLETQGQGALEIGDNVVISRGVHIVSQARVDRSRSCHSSRRHHRGQLSDWCQRRCHS